MILPSTIKKHPERYKIALDVYNEMQKRSKPEHRLSFEYIWNLITEYEKLLFTETGCGAEADFTWTIPTVGTFSKPHNKKDRKAIYRKRIKQHFKITFNKIFKELE